MTGASPRNSLHAEAASSQACGLRFCGIVDEPMWPGTSGSAASPSSVLCSLMTLERDPFERSRQQREAGHDLGQSIPGRVPRRDRLGEPEAFAEGRTHQRRSIAERRKRARSPGKLPDENARAASAETLGVPL